MFEVNTKANVFYFATSVNFREMRTKIAFSKIRGKMFLGVMSNYENVFDF